MRLAASFGGVKCQVALGLLGPIIRHTTVSGGSNVSATLTRKVRNTLFTLIYTLIYHA